jgi:hypothetical protein
MVHGAAQQAQQAQQARGKRPPAAGPMRTAVLVQAPAAACRGWGLGGLPKHQARMASLRLFGRGTKAL